MTTEARRGPEPPDISEKGGMKGGQPQRSDIRLFMQLLAFGGCADAASLAGSLARADIAGVLYEDLNDPHGVALLTFSEDPSFFVDRVRPLLNQAPFASLVQKPDYTMLGRTYSLGYEPDLVDVLQHRPRRTVLNPDWRWRSSESSSPSTGRSACRSAPAISRTTFASPVTVSTGTTMTSWSASMARSCIRSPRSCR
jgi:hypothetical protein